MSDIGRRQPPRAVDGPNEDAGLVVGSLVGVAPEESLADRLTLVLVLDGAAEGLEVSVGEADPDGLGEEVSVGVGVVGVGVGDGDVGVGEGDGDDVPVPVGVAVGLALVVELGVLDGVVDGQSGAVAE